MSYADIRKSTAKSRPPMRGYKNGGATSAKKSSTTVNIVVPSARGDGAPKAPPIAPAGGGAGMPSPMPSPPPAPMSPSAGQAGLAALGAPPTMKRGGVVKGKPMNTKAMAQGTAKQAKVMVKKVTDPKGGAMASGGNVAMKAGAGGGLGRLEKARAAKRK